MIDSNVVGNSLRERLPGRQADVTAALASAFAAEGKELALVGGFVRDLLLGQELLNELDFATNALPDETTRIAAAANPTNTFDIGARFGTIGLVFATDAEPITVEITTYRSEHYPSSTRHPEVAFGQSLIDDLSRRDFTINAMAIDSKSGRLIDPFDGQADLALSLLQAVGDPDERFQEDPLRMLRAARFVSQLGFRIDPNTKDAMSRQAESLSRISMERIFAELTRTLTGPYASAALEELRQTSLFRTALPELVLLAAEAEQQNAVHRQKDLWRHTIQVVDQAPARPAVRWAALLHDAAKPQTRKLDTQGEIHFIGHEQKGAEMAQQLLARLKADRTLQTDVAKLVELHYRPESYDPGWTDSAVRRLMLEAGGVLKDLLDLGAADVTSAREERQLEAKDRIVALRQRIAWLEAERDLAEFRSPLDGNDLMTMFERPPGRWIATIKDHLREMVLDGELEPGDREEAARIAMQTLKELNC